MRHEGPISKHILSLSRGPSTSVTCYRDTSLMGSNFTQENEKMEKEIKIVELL